MQERRRCRRRRERGVVMPLTAMLIAPMMIMAAIAVDVGGWYVQLSRMQRAADAASLAGVVWMPNFSVAQTVARTAAARNGYAHGVGGVTVTVTSPGDEQLTVVITSPGQVYLGRIVTNSVSHTRRATAEYVLPVPLGSPRNYFGTGNLLPSTFTVGGLGGRENLWLSINTWCTDKVDGDRYQSQYDGNRPYSAQNCPSNPAGTSIENEEYKSTGYELYIELPASRPSATDIRLYDARYAPGTGGPDLQLASNSGSQNYTFTLYGPDSTPLDDSDNLPVAGCSRTFTSSTAFEYSYLGTAPEHARWNDLCTNPLPTSAASGRYILRMTNQAGARYAVGANNFSVAAVYGTPTGTSGLCDARSTTNCPRVYAKAAMSVYADQEGQNADFFLSEIRALHAGKQLRITLFDPGEGGNLITIRQPTGSNTWADVNFSWTSSNGTSANNVSSLNVNGSQFNGHSVTIFFTLPSTYSPPAANAWWQIHYNFSSGDVTDRTTWSAQIVGDPVHLVE